MAGAAAIDITMTDAAPADTIALDAAPANALAMAGAPANALAVVDVSELMLERVRLAMDREALRSFVVERHYVRGPASSEDVYWSWKRAFELQADILQSIGNQAADVHDLAYNTGLEDEVNAEMSEMREEVDEAVKLSREITANGRSGTLIRR